MSYTTYATKQIYKLNEFSLKVTVEGGLMFSDRERLLDLTEQLQTLLEPYFSVQQATDEIAAEEAAGVQDVKPNSEEQ